MEIGAASKYSSWRYRYGMLIMAIVFASQIRVEHDTLTKFALSAYQNLANVASINATVPPNEYNSLAEQFAQKDKDLTLREQELLARERALGDRYQAEITANKRSTFYTIGIATLILVVLIVANFYFDIKREESHEEEVERSKRNGLPTT